jgi:hypothetical protein
MIATNIKTIRASVIRLLVEQHHSPITAVDLWDRVYSKQIRDAKPGTHTLKIGRYDLEYIKPDVPSPVPLEALIDRTRSPRQIPIGLIVLALVIIGLAIVIATSTAFEDGSFIALGGLIDGCLPFALCNTEG